MHNIIKKLLLTVALMCTILLTGCTQNNINKENTVSLETIPQFEGKAYVELNGNIPSFPEEDKTKQSFEHYEKLDVLGRARGAYANIGKETMPKEKRGSISSVHPTGWNNTQYNFVDGKYLYNRCHLIGYQLTAENANERNLITGTRYMNVEGMLPFENMVADYIKETGNHVLYRVTPIYEGDNLVANGVEMEAESIEDNGEGIQFHVFVYNVQPLVDIDYRDGSSQKTKIQSDTNVEIRGNSRSKIYHCPGQNAYKDMKDSKNLVIFSSEEEAKAAGYRKAKQ
ncbi:DNA/RNA non-specific endonuclease [Amedibacterium intestinale]|uniref:DNA/RNA non-specific endonuclease n=1 Tax=Amedibacterium intestinale TaxID=2583452 RepID=UPI000E200F9F